jgi:hypothetical protein
MKPLLALLAIVAFTSCSNDYATATPGFYKEVTPVNPDAQFGIPLATSTVGVDNLKDWIFSEFVI